MNRSVLVHDPQLFALMQGVFTQIKTSLDTINATLGDLSSRVTVLEHNSVQNGDNLRLAPVGLIYTDSELSFVNHDTEAGGLVNENFNNSVTLPGVSGVHANAFASSTIRTYLREPFEVQLTRQ